MLFTLWIACTIASVWAVGAIYYDGPFRARGNAALGVAWAVLVLVVVIMLRDSAWLAGAWPAALLAVGGPWLAIRPRNDRRWQAEWAMAPTLEIEDERCVIRGFRNFEYAPDAPTVERWETRTVHLGNLRSVDLILGKFGEPLIAHPILSFDAGPDGRIAVSVETRREEGETFSKLGGLYKMFELCYVIGDERDLITLRTLVEGVPVYLYRLRVSPDHARQMFLETAAAANALTARPRFYNLVTANCTTSLHAQAPKERRLPFDIRLLLNGLLDKMLYERSLLEDDGLAFGELRARARVNEAANRFARDPEFSARIRDGHPGMARHS